jgi:predicted ferric reductase
MRGLPKSKPIVIAPRLMKPTISSGPALLRMALYVLIVLTPLLIVVVLRPKTDHGFIYTVGKNLGLIGFAILEMQFVLAARFRWIERPFGLNILFDFHKTMAVLAMLLILSHPLLLALGGPQWNLIFGPDISWHIWLGRIAILILLLHVFLALFRFVIKLNYQTWRFVHDLGALTVSPLIFFHSWNAGGDLALPPMRIFWCGLVAAAAGAFIWQRLLRPLMLSRQPYEVTGVREEVDGVWTIELAPPKGVPRFDFLPGQFHFLTFYRAKNLPVEEHHWTISSSPTEEGILASTIKESGDFTSSIGKTKPGDKALVYGPFGRFSYLLHPEEHDLVFIAGGIGITPMISMLRHMKATQTARRVTLLFANHGEKDIAFRNELAALEKCDSPQVKVIHVLSNPGEHWLGEKGHIDLSKIERLCGGDLAKRAFYLCMPSAAMKQIIGSLRLVGVPPEYIHFEKFNL